MQIALTHTYFLDEDPHEREVMKPYPPLGILYLSAWLKQHNIDVRVYDTTFSTYHKLIEWLDLNRPPVLGIHCNLLTKYTVLKLIQFCNQNNIIAVLGGPDASTQVEEFLDYGADAVISGEGEEALLAVIQRLAQGGRDLKGIANVAWRDAEGKIVQNPRQSSRHRLDEFPFPDRDAIDMEKYLSAWEEHHNQRSISLITARGCAFACKWCSHSVYGHSHRRRSPENVIEEIKQVISEFRPTHFWIADDVFTANTIWIRKFTRLLQQENLTIKYECIGRADRLSEETMKLLRKSGCYRLWIGAESGSQRILDAMSRGVTVAEVMQAREWCRRYQIEFGTYLMFGYPGEEMADVQATVDFIRDLQPDQYFTTVAYPLRGTDLFDEINERVIYTSQWDQHLQRELEISGRFTRRFYHYAAQKAACLYRLRQLDRQGGGFLRKIYYRARSLHCELNMRRLAHVRT